MPGAGARIRDGSVRRRPHAPPGGHHRGAALPEGPDLAERRAAANGEAGEPAGPDRVLGLLPPQLAADAALPQGLARALRGGRAARRSPCTPRAFRRAATRTRCAPRSSGSGSSTRSRSTRTSSCGAPTTTRAGRRATCSHRGCGSPTFHHGEGDYHGCERAIRELLETRRRRDLVPLVRAADDDDAPIVVPTADRDGAYSGPVRAPARSGSSAAAPASWSSTASRAGDRRAPARI